MVDEITRVRQENFYKNPYISDDVKAVARKMQDSESVFTQEDADILKSASPVDWKTMKEAGIMTQEEHEYLLSNFLRAGVEKMSEGWEGNPDIEDGEEVDKPSEDELKENYVSLVEDLAKYYAHTETGALDVELINEKSVEELRADMEDHEDSLEFNEIDFDSDAQLKAYFNLIGFLETYGKPEVDLTNIEISSAIDVEPEAEEQTTAAAPADEPEDVPEKEGLGFWGTIGKYTGISSALSALDNKNQRVELHTKVSKGTAYPFSLAGNFAAQVTDVGAFAAEIPGEYGLSQAKAAVEKTRVEEVRDNGDQAKKAGSDMLIGAEAPLEAVDGVLNIAGGIADGFSYLFKGGSKNNEVVKEMNEKTLKTIADTIKYPTDENYNEMKTAIREEVRWGISTEELRLMTSDQIREVSQKEQTPEAVKSVVVKTEDENGNEVERTITFRYASKEAVIRAAADATALDAQNTKSSELMTHQNEEGWDKVTKGYAQIREAVSDVAGIPTAAVDLVDAGLNAGIEKVTNKGIADFFTAPLKAVSGGIQVVTTSFDDKEGSTKAAAKKFWKGITFGFGGNDEEEPVKVTKNERKVTTDEELKAQDKAEMQESYIDKRTEALTAHQIVKADAVIGKATAALKNIGYTEAQAAAHIKNEGLDTIAHEAIAEEEKEINTEAMAIRLTNNSLKLDDAVRQAQRAENENVAGTGFWNFMDKAHSNKENKAGDRGFWKNAGAVTEGILLTPARELLTQSVTVADLTAASIGCVEVAVPIAAGARGVQKLVKGGVTIAKNNYNEALKKAGYEDLGEGLAYLAVSTALGYVGGTNHQTKCWHGKRHHHHTQTPHQPTPDETFIGDPGSFVLVQ